MTETDQKIWIEATADPSTGAPMCLLIWDEKRKAFPVDRVLATSRELHAAAAAAEDEVAMIGLIQELLPGRDGEAALSGMLRDLRQRRVALRMPEGPRPFLRIGAFCGFKTRKPLVQIELGSKQEQVSAEIARQLASDWYDTAIASIHDVRIRHTLAEHGFDVVAVEQFMTDLMNLDPEAREHNRRK